MVNKKRSITELGNPGNPHGEAGAEMLAGMNERHYEVTGWALGFFDFANTDNVLDIGCGGGETIRRMAEKVSCGRVVGVDHSELSVKISRENNKEYIGNGRVEVMRASVERLPFGNDSFDKIITVESFYFWPDPPENLKEVYRVLANKGKFLIVADINGDAELDESDIEAIEKFSLFNPRLSELEALMNDAGFRNVVIHTVSGKKWVCAEGSK